MTARDEQFLDVYRRSRVDVQMGFYESRIEEFRDARRQVALLAAVVFGLSSAIGVLAGFDLGVKELIAVFSVVLPAASTALAAYDALYGFDRHAKVYADALRSLVQLDPPAAGPEAVAQFVQNVEGVLRREQGQWGQLTADLEPVAAVEPQKD